MDKPKFYELINMVEQVNNASIIRYTEGFKQPIGISLIIVLSEIRKLGKCQPVELAKKLGYSKSSISTIINKLITASYIEQATDVHDRRKMYLHITECGMNILREAESLGQQYYESVYGILTEEELLQYINIQKKLLQQINSSK
ncbi:MAG: MarR family winged helix-turn-helix transcriptional regulator [Solibacillus sp.]|jgi:DNA-binding MarR family transcriptional regulator|uniref:MarR family winged helix-turn-helix transcriptional regulator n=1 Tax=unclassified Solibacillus TaxID=2637870 RepID=UPI0030F85E0D